MDLKRISFLTLHLRPKGSGSAAAWPAAKVGDTAPPGDSVSLSSCPDSREFPEIKIAGIKEPLSWTLPHAQKCPMEVTLENGQTAVWKPQKWVRADPEEYGWRDTKREAAAYIVDQAMGHFAGVPKSIYCKIGGEPGALIDKVTDACDGGQVAILEDDILAKSPLAYGRIAVFDEVIGNPDRNRRNYLILKKDVEPADGQNGGRRVLKRGAGIIPIDHELAFPEFNPVNPDERSREHFGERISPLPADARCALKKLAAGKKEVTQKLKPYLSRPAIDAMWHRVEKILANDGV